MKSPFPGMDPFIEACGLWGDFHHALIGEIHRVVSETLPPGYVARMGKRSYIVLAESEEKLERHFEPDVSVTAPRRRKPTVAGGGVVATEGESMPVRAFVESEFVEQFIDVYELEPERRLVTSIEVLSPSNKKKRGPGWKKYLRKRQTLLLGKANLVELDLLRGGTRLPMLDPLPASPYYLLVAREEQSPLCRVWPAYYDKPLPNIPIPLSKPAPDLSLALQPLLEIIYDRSRYHLDIDYQQPLTPPLTDAETAWLQTRLRTVQEQTAPSPKSKRSRRG